MIPITLSIIGARSAGQKPLTGFLTGLCVRAGYRGSLYGAWLRGGIFGKSIDFLLRYKTFWLLLSLFFIAMGIAARSGRVTIQLPARFTGKLQGATSGKGGFSIGAFLIGIVTGVAASPCGSPVLAGLMAFGVQNAGRPVPHCLPILRLCFRYGHAVYGTGDFPCFLKAMPKSGGWMDDVKKFLGAVLIGVGIYYLQNAMRGMPGPVLARRNCQRAGGWTGHSRQGSVAPRQPRSTNGLADYRCGANNLCDLRRSDEASAHHAGRQ